MQQQISKYSFRAHPNSPQGYMCTLIPLLQKERVSNTSSPVTCGACRTPLLLWRCGCSCFTYLLIHVPGLPARRQACRVPTCCAPSVAPQLRVLVPYRVRQGGCSVATRQRLSCWWRDIWQCQPCFWWLLFSPLLPHCYNKCVSLFQKFLHSSL